MKKRAKNALQRSQKHAFTMVELIFVIVILGILAAVAVPRLAASHEDAQIAAAVVNMRTALNDIYSYYLSNGEIEQYENFSSVSNVPFKPYLSGSVYYVDDKPCLQFYAHEKNCLIIAHHSSQSSPACKKALAKADFLVGDDVYSRDKSEWCDASKASANVQIMDAKTFQWGSGKPIYQSVGVHFGALGVEP